MLKILCVGPIWTGSNANAMFDGLSRIGHITAVVDENYFINLSQKSFLAKAVAKISRTLQITEFNNEILRQSKLLQPDIVLIYKGAFVKPETVLQLKKKFVVVNFYPDVSFRTHGGLLPKTLPLYHHIFTTKTFGITDLKEQLNFHNSSFIPHGFDPTLHRKMQIPENLKSYYDCDASFIGGWSEKKEQLVSTIKLKHPETKLKIWGGRWENATNDLIKKSTMLTGIHGDLYVIGINASKINLGIVHEKVMGASSGDFITSRTFHIPGSGGFMIHEYNEESITYFKENEEAVFYKSEDDLADKVNYYLTHETERLKIQAAGYERAHRDHKIDERAKLVVEILKKEFKF
ncbi:MAG: glycosyltransferase [Cytophagales bacterium]